MRACCRPSNTLFQVMQVQRRNAPAVQTSLSHTALAAAAAVVETISIAGNCLQTQDMPILVQLLCKFPALKHLDVSANPLLLPLDMLQFASRLETFACNDCALVLPPQSLMMTPNENPSRIRQFFEGASFATELKQIRLSSCGITSAIFQLLLPLLQKFLVLIDVDMSHNALSIEDVCKCFASLAAIRSVARVSFVRPTYTRSCCALCDCSSKVTPWFAGRQSLRLVL